MNNGNLPKYEIVIYWDKSDEIYVAEIPALAGCSAHGKTQVEAVQNVNEAIYLWLDTAHEFGDVIPQPRQHQLAA